MSSWFYVQNGNRIGPVTLDLLIEMVRNNQLQAGSLVWTDREANWQPIENFSWFHDNQPDPSAANNARPIPPPLPLPQFGTLPPPFEIPPPPVSLISQSVLMLICCGVLGIVGGVMGLIQDSIAKSAYARGDYAEAKRAIETGQKWLNNCMWCTLVFYGLFFLCALSSGALQR